MVSTQQETQQPSAEGWAGQWAAYGEQTQTQPETNPSLGALASFPDYRASDGSCNQPVFLMSFSPSPCYFFSPTTLLSTLPPPVHVSSVFLISFLTFSLSHCLSDIWERDLVELVLEVSVSQVSHRQRDMLLRQVGVLLGVLDSDIIVREISAFNEHRWGAFFDLLICDFV